MKLLYLSRLRAVQSMVSRRPDHDLLRTWLVSIGCVCLPPSGCEEGFFSYHGGARINVMEAVMCEHLSAADRPRYYAQWPWTCRKRQDDEVPSSTRLRTRNRRRLARPDQVCATNRFWAFNHQVKIPHQRHCRLRQQDAALSPSRLLRTQSQLTRMSKTPIVLCQHPKITKPQCPSHIGSLGKSHPRCL